MSDQLGTELKCSKYRVLGLVGQGQFGRVYCAVHRQTGRLVALKNLEHQRFPTHKFLRELRFLLSLQHPNIVNCQALEHTRTGRCLVMDYCEGGTLRHLMNEDVCLSLPQSLKLIADVLAGLEHAHSRGIVHCDIKPENILLTLQPHGWVAKVSDFGIARLSQELLDDKAGNTGSPAYMAPERFYGQYSITSDLYSVGILLFELITGQRPFSGTPAELMSAHLNCPIKLPDSIPTVWHPLILTSLQKLSARRFRSAAEMLAMLKSIAAIEGSGSWLDPQASQQPLLRSTTTLPVGRFEPQRTELLMAPITDLAADDEMQDVAASNALANVHTAWYMAEGKQLHHLAHAGVDLNGKGHQEGAAPKSFNTVVLTEPIRQLFACAQGCFAVTDQAVYFAEKSQSRHLTAHLVAPLELNHDVVIQPRGRWLAAVISPPEADQALLRFGRLSHPSTDVMWSSPIKLLASAASVHGLRVLAIDSRHAAVISSLPVKGDAAGSRTGYSGTLIEIFTRRGNRITTLKLPICLERVVLTSTPYRLLAIDCEDPYSVLVVDLKPFRVIRFAVEIVPHLLCASEWGYVLADADGHLVFLDPQGRQINRLDVPANVTAIAPIHPHGLLVATWAGNQGNLYILDLKVLDVDWLF